MGGSCQICRHPQGIVALIQTYQSCSNLMGAFGSRHKRCGCCWARYIYIGIITREFHPHAHTRMGTSPRLPQGHLNCVPVPSAALCQLPGSLAMRLSTRMMLRCHRRDNAALTKLIRQPYLTMSNSTECNRSAYQSAAGRPSSAACACA
jgi:hypothetical protein